MSAEDDLQLKIEIQAKLDQGQTLQGIKALEDQLDGLMAKGALTPETFIAIDNALQDTRRSMDDLSISVQRLASRSAVRGMLNEQATAAREVAAANKQAARDFADAEKAKAAAAKATAAEVTAAAKAEAEAAQYSLSPYARSAITSQQQTNMGFSVASPRSPLSISTLSATDAGRAQRLLGASAFNTSPIPTSLQASYDQFRAKVETLNAAFKGQAAAESAAAAEALALARAQAEATQAQEALIAKTAATVKAQELAQNPVTDPTRQIMGNFYPLIIAAGIFGGLAKKTESLGAAAAKTAADYQAAFASVARTTNSEGTNAEQAVEGIRKSLLQLDTQIPLTFEDLSKIATAGNEIGVSSAGITSFTKTVAEYSQVTGAAADVTATAFGSLGTILRIPSTEYENFGSAISLVGRKSVATEAEVLSMTAKIGASAHQANFTTGQILGLAGALASLREAPERSQGALEIYFKNVNAAAAAGGDKLQKFAQAVHLSATETADLIKNNPYGFLLKLLQAIGDQKGIVAQTTMLQGLGLSATRVSEVLRRLSTNTDLLGQLTTLANQGYAQGTDLSTQYAKATDTLAARFAELQNAFSNLLAAFGNSGLAQLLTGLVDGLKIFVTWLTDLAQANPVITNLVIAFAALAGGLFAFRAIVIAATIATMALETAQVRLGGVKLMDGLRVLSGLLFGYTAQTKAAAAAAAMQATAEERMIQAMLGSGVVTDRAAAMKALGIAEVAAGTDAEVAAGGIGVLRGALMTLGIPALLIGLGALATTLLSVSDASASFDKTGLQNTLKADTAQYNATGKAIKTYNIATQDSVTATDPWVAALNRATGAQATLNANTQTTTKSIGDQIVAYGKSSKAFLANTLANDSAFQKLFSDQNASKYLSKIGFNPGEFAAKIVNDPTGSAGAKYLQTYLDKITTSGRANQNSKSGGGGFDAYQAKSALDGLKSTIDLVKAQTEAAAAADAAFGIVAVGTGQSIDTQTGAIIANTGAKADNTDWTTVGAAAEDKNIDTLFASVNAYYAQSAALATVGQEYVNNGGAAAFSGAAFQTYIKSVVDSAPDATSAADQLQELENSILASGYAANASAPSLDYLNAVISSLGGSSTTALATQTFPSFTDAVKQAQDAMNSAGGAGNTAANGIGNAGNAAAKAAKQIITVADYANNLSGVFKEAFDIRFGKQQGLDDITQQFQSMQDNAKSAKKSIDDARKSIQQYEASISKTRADNQQQRYFLGIANQFGDSNRAAAIQGTIDTNNASISSDTSSLKQAQLDLATAEDTLNKSYTSNTAGAVANREALYTLAQKYEDYITKLAASGADQKTLNTAVKQSKDNFDKQATALGYNKTAIDKVKSAFDDMTVAIKKVPPANVKITGLSAGEAAVKNFMTNINKTISAGANAANNSLKGIGTHFSFPRLIDPNSLDAIMAGAVKTEIGYLDNMFNQQTDGGVRVSNAALANLRTMNRLQHDLETHNWADAARTGLFSDGGYTGPGGKYETAGLVHRGEYVVPANMVNQSTGLPYADALGRLISGTMPHASYAGGGYVNPDMMVVEPGPKFIREIRNMVRTEVNAVITPGQIAGAANSANAINRRRGR